MSLSRPHKYLEIRINYLGEGKCNNVCKKAQSVERRKGCPNIKDSSPGLADLFFIYLFIYFFFFIIIFFSPCARENCKNTFNIFIAKHKVIR